ncbi:hypothetical protein [Acinetobacter pragensis]|uniref:Chromosome partitioning protein ParB n=1 Tax=Acinetobacter pragensis TaxID=1806892 RepID=A0A151Y583_9GAMM|nr:hypothetical protein [Acinetobacter pragensis]KYQ73140.1 hypothetical protein AZH43_06800 [Acinetobacter pragensis]
MRRQYHFRQIGEDTHIWDVHHLIQLSSQLAVKSIPLSEICELNESYWFPHHPPTTQQIIDHLKLIEEADLSYPIILCAEGKVMDGMHRVAKAALLKRSAIDAVQFKQTPPPDFINVEEDALDYEDD